MQLGSSSPLLFTYLAAFADSINCEVVSIHSAMVPLRKSDSYSLQAHDIYFQKRQAVGNCPAEIQNLFKLVIGIKDLNADHFGGYETADPKHAVFPSTILPEFSPRQEYERELKVEADELSITYSDSRRADDNEEKWVQELEPVVFYRFNREREEKYERDRHHHWQVIPWGTEYYSNISPASSAENTTLSAVAH